MTQTTEPAAPTSKPKLPWTPFSAVIVTVAIYLASAVAAGFLVSLYPIVRQVPAGQRDAWLSTTVAQFWYVLAVEAITIGLLIAFVRWRKGSFTSLGMVKPRLRDPLIALPALVVYLAAYAILLTILTSIFKSINVNQAQDLGFGADQAGIGIVLTFISLVILPPLVEETTMRGFLFTSLREKLTVPVAALVTSALFATAHLEFGSGGPLVWVAAIDTFTLSLVLCYLRYKTGSLWPGISLHALKNLIAFMALFVFHIS